MKRLAFAIVAAMADAYMGAGVTVTSNVTARTIRLCGLADRLSMRRLWLAFGAGLALLLTLLTKWLLGEFSGLGFDLNAVLVTAYGFAVAVALDLCRRAALQAIRKCTTRGHCK